MDHIAIMKPSWRLLPKILSGTKTIESRWYQTRRAPWNRIHARDTIYFKDSGKPVTIRATVERVLQFENLTPAKVRELVRTYGLQIGIPTESQNTFITRFENKRYCILMFLTNPAPITPFSITKKGFGSAAAWITIPSIDLLKRESSTC